MKITVFQSDKGDCLLIESKGKRMLVDGGMRDAYKGFVAPALGKLRKQKKQLDLVYVSHIDQDHISGILEMLDNLVDWRVHDFQSQSGNTAHQKPKVPRPPEIGRIWHNAFSELIEENRGEVADMLAHTATLLLSGSRAAARGLGRIQQELATSVREAIEVSRRVGAKQLNIPLNPEFDGKLILVRDPPGPEATLGGMSIYVVGPFASDVTRLRRDWNDWLESHKTVLATIERNARADQDDLGTSVVDQVIAPLLAQAAALGDRSKVTPPNLASVMLYIEEGVGAAQKTLLLTGDGHSDDIVAGLEHQGKLNGSNQLHVDVLKVQHHGSEHNIDDEFCRRVTADNYIFCGNGKHENPDRRVVKLIAESRLAQRPTPFTLWFNSSSQAAPAGAPRTHMRAIERLVQDLSTASGNRVTGKFIKGGSFDVVI